ncbi:MAG TPA: twin-arginine translocase TatA/TatE family subunit [Acidimicrobiales bacterium]|nr:twin-arginine translocase TatA/TatE family subunit [Acidimicrobiales bacterium]
MGFLDPAKILVVLVFALIVLGPERLPRAARQLGAAWRELTRVREQVTEEIRSAMPDLDLPSIPRLPTNMVSGFIADLTKPSVANVGGEAVGEAGVHGDLEDTTGELLSSSATGTIDDDASTGAPFGGGTVAAGRIVPAGTATDAGYRVPGDQEVRARSGAFDAAPVIVDDPSMN